MSAAHGIDTVGPTAHKSHHPRWRVVHRASGLEHETQGRSQYAFGAVAFAIEEGFAMRVLDAGQPYPTFSDLDLSPIVEGETPDPNFGKLA